MINVHEINQSILKKLIRGIFNKFGFEIKKKDNWYDRYKDSVVELNPKLKKYSKSNKIYPKGRSTMGMPGTRAQKGKKKWKQIK